MSTKRSFDTSKLVLLAMLTAIVAVLQLLASFFPVYPFTLNLVLMPIVVGAALLGKAAGAWLGFVFGFVVLISDKSVVYFMQFNAPATILVILGRGIAIGFAAAAVYKLLEKKGKTIAVVSAAIIAPIVNTGLFVLGLYAFFLPLISDWAVGFANATAFIFIVLVGVNFIFEFAVNLVLSPTIVRLIQHRRNTRALTVKQ